MTKSIVLSVVALCAFASALAQGEVVGEVVVRGNKNVPESTILATIRTKVGQVYQQSQLNRDRQSLEALGFFQDVKIYGQQMENSQWRVVVEVVEWPIVSTFDITGNTIFTDEEILKVLTDAGIKTGSVLNVSYVDKAAQAVSDLYRSKGFFARIGKFEPKQEDPTVVAVEIVEARVSKITVTGNTRTKRKVFDRLIDTKEGELLNQKKWADDLRRVWETRWFENIKPDSREPELGKVELIIDVQETRTGLFNVGLQLDPKNKLAGFFSISDSNFRGSGKSVGVNVLQSAQGLGTSISLDYGEPFLDSHRTALQVSVYSRESLLFGSSQFGGGSGGGLNDEKFSQRRTGAAVSLSRPFGNGDSRGSVALRAERISTNFTPDPGEEFITMEGDIASFALGFTRNKRDSSIDPAKGDWVRLQVEPSYSNITSVGGLSSGFSILGPNFYTRTTLDYRRYFSKGPQRKIDELDQPRRVVATRVYLGTIFGEVPFSEQLFIGGANSLRGYQEDRFWGRHAALAQLEYRHPLQKTFNIVAFVDYGGAWNGYGSVREFLQSRSLDLHLGYGVGIHFKTAFGPIRLDLGFDERGQSRVHFLIGPSF